MKKILLLIPLLWGFFANAQVTFTAPVAYTTGTPSGAPSTNGSRIRVDLLNNKVYQWNPTFTTWEQMPYGIDQISGTSSPAYVPGIGDSEFAINFADSLYRYRSGAWRHINKGGGGAGATNLSYTTSPTDGTVNSDTGNDATLPLATGTNAGLESPSQFTKLSNVTITQPVDLDVVETNSGYYNVVQVDGTPITQRAALNFTGWGGNVVDISGNTRVNLDGELGSIAAGTTNGYFARTGSNVVVARTLTGSTRISVTNGNGTTGNPVFDLATQGATSGQVLQFDGANWSPGTDDAGLSSVATDATLTGDGTGGAPLGVAFPILAPDGNSSAPSYSFSTDVGSGVYFSSGGLRVGTSAGVQIELSAGAEAGVNIQSSNVSGGITPGAVSITSGSNTDNARAGGALNITSGSGSEGGTFLMESGDGASGDGGNFTMSAGLSVDATGGLFSMFAGSSTNGAGGGFSAAAGSGVQAGGFFMAAGDASGADETGGQLAILAGDGPSGFGGVIDIRGGEGNESGGVVGISGGDATTGTGGDVSLIAGDGPTNNLDGKITLFGNGVVLPVLTTTQRNALSGVSLGTVIINSTTGNVQWYNGSGWANL